MQNELISSNNNSGFMHVDNLQNAIKCSQMIASSSFCPASMKGKPGDVLVALQMGQELGLKPMQALQNICVINGRPSVWGDAQLAICRNHADWEYIDEKYDEASLTATCTIKRKGQPELSRTFSKKQAEKAGLWGKSGPWTTYPDRMIQMRARGFATRDCFGDVLRGFVSVEEAQDIPTIELKQLSSSKNMVKPRLISSDELKLLKEKIFICESKEDDICKYYKIHDLCELDIFEMDDIFDKLNRKIEQKMKMVENIGMESISKSINLDLKDQEIVRESMKTDEELAADDWE